MTDTLLGGRSLCRALGPSAVLQPRLLAAVAGGETTAGDAVALAAAMPRSGVRESPPRPLLTWRMTSGPVAYRLPLRLRLPHRREGRLRGA